MVPFLCEWKMYKCTLSRQVIFSTFIKSQVSKVHFSCLLTEQYLFAHQPELLTLQQAVLCSLQCVRICTLLPCRANIQQCYGILLLKRACRIIEYILGRLKIAPQIGTWYILRAFWYVPIKVKFVKTCKYTYKIIDL